MVEASSQFSSVEAISLWAVLGTVIAGFLYAGFLVRLVFGEDQEADEMKKVASAILISANAYLARQFKTIAFLILLLTVPLSHAIMIAKI